MWIDGVNYRLAKHAYKRFRQRINPKADQNEIIRQALEGLPGYRFVWKSDRKEGMRLVTVVKENALERIP